MLLRLFCVLSLFLTFPLSAKKTKGKRFQAVAYKEPVQKKTLVVAVGIVRGSQLAHESLERHLLKPYGADLFLCTNESDDHSAYIYQLATYLAEYPTSDDWRLVTDEASLRLFGHKKWRNYEKFLPQSVIGQYDEKGKWTGIGAGLLMFNTRYYALEWLEQQGLLEEYDYFIFARPDYYYLATHPDPATLLAKGHHIAIPFANSDFGGICDRFAVADQIGIKAYLSVLPFFLSSYFQPGDNTERLLLKTLQNGYTLRTLRYKAPCYMVREDADGALTWSAGTKKDPNGLWIKDKAEYTEAIEYVKSH